jgi:F-type H+-transporting ATPase subunit delta
MTDALEDLGADAVLAAAEQEGRLDRVEDELFRFERLVAADQGLRDALINQDASTANKAALVSRLLDGKVAPEAVRLARQAVLAPRGRRFPQVIKEYLRLAARRREQLTAVVTSAIALDAAQHARLRAALSGLYGRPVFVTAVVNPELLGGVHVRIGDDVVDGTVARRLEDARRAMEG